MPPKPVQELPGKRKYTRSEAKNLLDVTPIKNRRVSPKRKNFVDSPPKDTTPVQGKKGK